MQREEPGVESSRHAYLFFFFIEKNAGNKNQTCRVLLCCALMTRLWCSWWCETDMTEKCLLTASRDLADTGTYRAFLVSDFELPTDQARVDQENQIAQCLAMAGITADKETEWCSRVH